MPGAESAEPSSTWSDLDVDSLDLVEVVKALEDRYEVQIADGRLKAIATVGDAVAPRAGARGRARGRPGVTATAAATADVVVTGRGVVSSIGEGADAFFDALLAKRSGIADGGRRLHGVRRRARR